MGPEGAVVFSAAGASPALGERRGMTCSGAGLLVFFFFFVVVARSVSALGVAEGVSVVTRRGFRRPSG